MKSFLTIFLLAASAFAASAAPDALDDAGLRDLLAIGGTSGIVESVREAPASRDLHAFDSSVLEHALRPSLADEVVVRLDRGWIITVTTSAGARVQPGQRVRVLSSYGELQLQAD